MTDFLLFAITFLLLLAEMRLWQIVRLLEALATGGPNDAQGKS